MATTTLEIERKYEVPPGFALPDLTGLSAVASVEPRPTVRLDATYHDTEDLRLGAQRMTLRRRAGGEDEGWHLKRPAAEGKTETREPLSDRLPETLAAEVRPATGGAALRPVARVRNRRRETALRDGAGRVLAVIAEDKVRGDRLIPPRRTAKWRELEVELVDGERGLLDAVEAVLRTAGARPSPATSKLGRALEDAGPACLAAYLRAQRDAVVENDPGVRAEDADAVHDMRVAIRRLRATLRTYRPVFDRTRTEPLRDELHWLAGLLGPVRDADVLRDRIAEQVDGSVRQRVLARVAVDQARARAALAAALDGDRYATVRRSLDALSTDESVAGTRERATTERLRKGARKALRRADQRLDSALAATEDRDAGLHQARKAYKRARYAAELVTPLVGRRARKLAKRLGALQDVLGDHHDRVVAAALLRDFGIDAGPVADPTADVESARRRAAKIRL